MNFDGPGEPAGAVVFLVGSEIERELTNEQVGTIQQTGVSYTNKLRLEPGRYAVRVVVRDNQTGRMGSTTTMLDVQ